MTATQRTEPVSNAAKRDILASIRRNLEKSRPFDAAHHRHSVEVFHPETAPPAAAADLVERFEQNLISVGGSVFRVKNEPEAATAVREIVEKLGAKRIAISDSVLLEGLTADLKNTEIERNAPREFLFDCDLGITSAQWAIAETGTLVLESEKESHRLTSLVPPVHLCVVKASNIRKTLAEILDLTRRDLSRTVTFITGASRTSDIELTLAIGVHGPGELYVVLVEEDAKIEEMPPNGE